MFQLWYNPFFYIQEYSHFPVVGLFGDFGKLCNIPHKIYHSDYMIVELRFSYYLVLLFDKYTNIICISSNCGDVLRGRTDKKFCSDQCRNNYNNKLNRDSNNFVRNVHGLLRKNRRILSDLYSEGKVKVHKDALFALGYNFSFFTHMIETSQGQKFHYCFEFGYRETGDDFLELNQNSQYIEYQ